MTIMSKFDFSVFDTVAQANKGAKLHLTVPGTKEPAYADDKEKKPLTITLLGTDSDVFTKEQQAKLRKMRIENKKGKKADDVDLEKNIKEACETYAKLTVGWENMPSDFSYENAVELYTKYKDIRVQVGDFIAEQANFIQS